MTLFRHPFIYLLMASSFISQVHAEHQSENFYRNFWSPTYHIERLSYCTVDGKECGMAVAGTYCKMLGYEKAKEAIIDYNVGLTNYLLTSAQCKGWGCNGFMLITCEGKFSHKPAKKYHYRLQQFVFPRFDQYRVDWCYDNGKGCGLRAAYSFCRKMGYMKARSFKKQEHVSATKALGNQRLCFGDTCSGFSSITCFR